MESDKLDTVFYCHSRFCLAYKDVDVRRVGPHIGVYCRSCGNWITWIPKDHRMSKALPRTSTEAEEIKKFPQEPHRDEECPF